MRDGNVTVPLTPPCKVRTVGKSYFLDYMGDDMQLPVKMTELHMAGELVASVTIPRWLAEDRGLVEAVDDVVSLREEHDDDRMSRRDWYVLGLTMAHIARGDSWKQAAWEAKKAVAELMEE